MLVQSNPDEAARLLERAQAHVTKKWKAIARAAGRPEDRNPSPGAKS